METICDPERLYFWRRGGINVEPQVRGNEENAGKQDV